MKKLILIIAIVFSGILLQGQKIEKGANTIIVTSDLSNEDLLASFAKHLQSEGHSIDVYHKYLLSLSTFFNTYKTSGGGTMKIDVVVDSNKLIINGSRRGETIYNSTFECAIEYKLPSGKDALKEMLRIAEAYPHSKLEIQKL